MVESFKKTDLAKVGFFILYLLYFLFLKYFDKLLNYSKCFVNCNVKQIL